MPRRAEAYSVTDRGRRHWYYKLAGWTTYKPTDVVIERSTKGTPTKRSRQEAESWAKIQYDNRYENEGGAVSFGEYAEPFYDWERCPRIARLRVDDSRAVSERHANNERNRLLNHLLGNPDSDVERNQAPDPIADMRLQDIDREAIVALKARLVAKLGHTDTVNKTLGLVRAIMGEAELQKRIVRSPYYRISKVKPDQVLERGTFTAGEMEKLFGEIPGAWRDIMEYAVFFLVANTGARRGEALALRWRHVEALPVNVRGGIGDPVPIHDREAVDKLLVKAKDDDDLNVVAVIHIDEAITSFAKNAAVKTGKPKWGKTRVTPAPGAVLEVLRQWQLRSKQTGPDNLVFCYGNGVALGETWWRKRFIRGIQKIGISDDERTRRVLVPHSFRHSLNMIYKRAGFEDAKIRAALGWADPDIQEVYTHWDVDSLIDLAGR